MATRTYAKKTNTDTVTDISTDDIATDVSSESTTNSYANYSIWLPLDSTTSVMNVPSYGVLVKTEVGVTLVPNMCYYDGKFKRI